MWQRMAKSLVSVDPAIRLHEQMKIFNENLPTKRFPLLHQPMKNNIRLSLVEPA